MKTIYKPLLSATLAISFCLTSVLGAYAQHNNSNTTSGSSGSKSTPSTGGGGGGGGAVRSFSAPSGSPSRPPGISSPRIGGVQQNTGNRQGTVTRGNYGFAPRQGVNINPGNPNRGNNVYQQRQGLSANPGSAFRGGNGFSPRVGGLIQNNSGYRPGAAVVLGKGDFWGNHGYYHNNHGYYQSYYAPRLGFTCTVLPYGYYPFFWGDYQYYYSDGLFYEYENDVYTVVEPPIGAEVTTLPSNAESIVINGQQYYEADGVYYQPYTKDDGTVVYQVAGKDGELNTGAGVQDQQPQGPQMGDIVLQLPSNCRKINVNGQKLYVSQDGIYYQQLVDANGNITYKIVGLPSDEPDQN